MSECVECGSNDLCEYCYIKSNPKLNPTINKNCSKCNIQLQKEPFIPFITICGISYPRYLCIGCYYIERPKQNKTKQKN